MQKSKFVSIKWALVMIAAYAGLSACGSDFSRLTGLPSEDVDLWRMRWHFSKSSSISSVEEIVKLGTEWNCVQRTAIARSIHTSYFTRRFTSLDSKKLQGTASFNVSPVAESKGVFHFGVGGTVSASQVTETDRYQLPYENATVSLRLYEKKKLVEEWTVSKSAHVTGRGFALVPELVIINDQKLMESAISDTSQNVFLYASCDVVK